MIRWLAIAAVALASIAARQPVEFDIAVADLPAFCRPTQPRYVNDGADAFDCTVGGRSTHVVCICNADGASYTAGSIFDAIQLTATDSPVTCAAGTAGAMYADTSLSLPCYCNGSDWVQMDDFSTSCTAASYVLREDSGNVLREDGDRIVRE